MEAIVINTGTELLLGDVLNTHLRFIARELFPLGIRISRQLTVPDGAAIQEAMAEAFAAAAIVFVTGGLGPTTDDITREAAAALLGLELHQDAAVAEAITERLRTRGFPMTDRVLRQAEVPAGATVLQNEHGTAPGLYLPAGSDRTRATPHLFLLPGPPRELEPMFRDAVLPILRRLIPGRDSARCQTFRLTGIGESVVEAAVGPQLLALPGIELGYCARAGEVDVRVIGPESTLQKAEALIRNALPEALYTITADESLDAVVVRLLIERRLTVATAESCTGGYLAHRFTNVPGASAAFLAGYVTYANEAKIRELNVSASSVESHGAVSEIVAKEMAEGALRNANTSYALSTTGVAGPDGGSERKPVGTVYIGLASFGGETTVQRRRFQTDRAAFKQLATQTALDMLRQRILAG